jgi:alpha-1,6-mannosyltransferase
MVRSKPIDFLFIALSATGYGLVAYKIQRHESAWLMITYTVLFAAYLWKMKQQEETSISFWLIVSFFFRLIFIFSLPALSDDFYRFVWDGRLWNAGYHPFAELPASYLSKDIPGIDQALYQSLNSRDYFTIYPPLSQAVFRVATTIFPTSVEGSVMVIRLLLLVAEAGNLILLRKLLRKFEMPQWPALLYALNPLVIIELTGNIHFDALVIFFLLLSVYTLVHNRKTFSISYLALAISVKLVPLIFIPAWFSQTRFTQWIKYGFVLATVTSIVFYPLWDQKAIQAMSESVGLYFNKFEFNASLYYIVREFGFWRYGYNIIQTVGWKLAVMATLLILFFSFRKGINREKEIQPLSIRWMMQDWMWIMMIYFLFATTLHPWYITTLLALSVFSTYRFPLVWTYFIFLSYMGYTRDSFQEILWLTGLEYASVYACMIYEWRAMTKRK